MNDVLPIVSLGDHGVVKQRDELQLSQAAQGLQVRKLLKSITMLRLKCLDLELENRQMLKSGVGNKISKYLLK